MVRVIGRNGKTANPLNVLPCAKDSPSSSLVVALSFSAVSPNPRSSTLRLYKRLAHRLLPPEPQVSAFLFSRSPITYFLLSFEISVVCLRKSLASKKAMAALLLGALLVVAATAAEAALVKEEPLVLTYHHGPLLTTATPAIDVHILWYGKFAASQRAIIADFISSLAGPPSPAPSVAAWWHTTGAYKDAAKKSSVARTRLGLQALDEGYSLGKLLRRADVARLVSRAVASRKLPAHSNSIFLVLTAADVGVEQFCMSACGFHDTLRTRHGALPFAWVGNSETQCPGTCAWPFHEPLYGPQGPPLVAPNADVGADGMVINVAAELAHTVTNPFNTGYFQGDALAPLEAVSACTGTYGSGSYPGYPGNLLTDPVTGASFNAHGANGRRFLVPAMWDPVSRSCKTLV